jgi:tight adherence protein B
MPLRPLRRLRSSTPGMFGRPGCSSPRWAVAFLAVVLVLLLLFYPRGDRAASRTLRRGVTMVQRGEGDVRPRWAYASTIAQSAIGWCRGRRSPRGTTSELQNDIDRAGWNLRAGEFTTLRVVGDTAGLRAPLGLTGSWLLRCWSLRCRRSCRRLLLSNARSRRQAKFMAQLPDTLQLLAGTLKAGYGVLQAIDTVVKEVEDPMSSEFQRALTEARLGLPLEDSLGLDGRAGGQRRLPLGRGRDEHPAPGRGQPCGTARDRRRDAAWTGAGHRQIQVLSAEGRLSAVILFACPSGCWPTCCSPTRLPGAAADQHDRAIHDDRAVLLMLVGWIWIRRLIKIEV